MSDASAPITDFAALRRWRNALLGKFGTLIAFVAGGIALSGMPAWGLGLAAGAAASGIAFYFRVNGAIRIAEGGHAVVNRTAAGGTVTRMLLVGIVFALAYKTPALDFVATVIGAFGMQIFLTVAVLMPGSAGITGEAQEQG
jgi:hypothetical protein